MLIDDFTLIQPIGKGAFGEVYLTSKHGCREKFATKKIEKKDSQKIQKLKNIWIMK